MAPTLAPELKIPVANARCFLGNHSATAFMAAGKLPASATPSPALAIPNPKVLFANACAIAAILQKNTDIE
ncbi:hypothetical protein D3C72_2497780 [compost metagenome]